MADTDVWGLGGPIGAPAAADRVPIATGPNAGGYSLRGSFAWKDATGKFKIDGDLYATRSEVPRLQLERAGVLNWYVGGSGVGGDNGFLIQLNANAPAFIAQSSGNNGTGTTSPQAKWHVKSTGEVMRLETTTARGSGACYQSFYDPTGQKAVHGFAGGNDNYYQINQLNTAMIFGTNNIERWSIFANGSLVPVADNAYPIGGASNRCSTLWAVTGTISTSDEREKTWRGAPTEAELRAAKRIIAELGFYQWNDAVAEKGENARFHFGPRAQRAWAIMADEGLIDPLEDGVTPSSKYAFLCYDEWPEIEPVEAAEEERDEEGNVVVAAQPAQPGRDAGNRFGIRPDQLAMFLVAAQEHRLAALEAILAEAE